MADKKTGASVKGQVQVYKFYKIEKGNKIIRTKRDCARCGRGVFMAEHKDRFSCGKCGFTEFHRAEAKPGNKPEGKNST
jgi:ubiquitin-small subunit ribosomal protein S27Ae